MEGSSMNFITTLNNFLLSEWLWSITWGIYHIPVTIILMTFLFKTCLRMKLKRAFLFSASAQISSGLLLTSFVAGFLIYFLKIQYSPEPNQMPNQFLVCIYLGLIYTILQAIFFTILSFFYTFPLRRALWLTLISNMLGAWIVSIFLPII